jgi:hypothetical protein
VSNYLTRLVARTLAPVALRPRARLRYEDAPALAPVPEETPAIAASRSGIIVNVPDLGTRAETDDVAEHRPSFNATGRPVSPAALDAPPREPRIDDDKPRPAVAFELPRVSREDAGDPPRTEIIRVEAEPQRVAAPPFSTPQTVVETRESVRAERETVTLHDERVVHTVDRPERTPAPPLSPRPRGEGTPVRGVTARRATPRSARHEPHPEGQPVEPIIQVSIGRIEVRATTNAAAPRHREAAPALTLDAYLDRRNGKGRR